MNYESTGLRQAKTVTSCERDIWNRGCAILKIFSGTIPASADAAETGTLLNTIKNDDAAAKVKRKLTITPVTSGTTGTWTFAHNGVTATWTDDGSPSVAEVCAGMVAMIKALTGEANATTPNFAVTAGPTYHSVDAVNNTTNFTIEAHTAGINFDAAFSATGAGNSFTVDETTEDAYGLQFEAAADVALGVMEKLATQTWKGTNVASGVASHARLVLDGDTGTLSTSAVRRQFGVSTANSELNLPTVQFDSGSKQEISTFTVTAPAS